MLNTTEHNQETGSKGTAILCIANQERQGGNLSGTLTVSIPDSMGGIAELIDEEERAVDLGTDDRLQEIMKRAEPSPAYGMVQVHIQNGMDDKIYAMIYEDKSGVRYIDFCQRYQDGSFSPRMRVEQSELLSFAKFEKAGNTADKGTKQRAARILSKAEKEYLGKFRGNPFELIDTRQIFLCLITALPSLPVYSDDDRQLRRIEFYRKLVEVVKGFQLQILYPHKFYYSLTEEEVMEAAQRMGMQKLAFLKKLKEFGFLYLTASSKFYQTAVREKYNDGKPCWRYCIFKFSQLAGIDEDQSENCNFDF